MSTLMQPLRDEHAALLPHVEELRTTADAVGSVTIEQLRAFVDDRLGFLVHHLIPHANAEDHALYPAVEEAFGARGVTATMSRDHVEVDRLTHELGLLREQMAEADDLDDALAHDLRRVLYGLLALLKVHFAKEEEIYVPLLEAALDAGEAAELFEQMDAAAEATRAH